MLKVYLISKSLRIVVFSLWTIILPNQKEMGYILLIFISFTFVNFTRLPQDIPRGFYNIGSLSLDTFPGNVPIHKQDEFYKLISAACNHHLFITFFLLLSSMFNGFHLHFYYIVIAFIDGRILFLHAR
jgi:hypothetical protein